jgi:hypothetical protein
MSCGLLGRNPGPPLSASGTMIRHIGLGPLTSPSSSTIRRVVSINSSSVAPAYRIAARLSGTMIGRPLAFSSTPLGSVTRRFDSEIVGGPTFGILPDNG